MGYWFREKTDRRRDSHGIGSKKGEGNANFQRSLQRKTLLRDPRKQSERLKTQRRLCCRKRQKKKGKRNNDLNNLAQSKRTLNFHRGGGKIREFSRLGIVKFSFKNKQLLPLFDNIIDFDSKEGPERLFSCRDKKLRTALLIRISHINMQI